MSATGGRHMVEKHPVAASASAPTKAQYAAVLSIVAFFVLGVLTLVGVL
ncbi:MAG TPA: hypothetical protein VLB81_08160 [Gaiellales bacterium]|nr:hypothetical protein [Gaiellales bacterium]